MFTFYIYSKEHSESDYTLYHEISYEISCNKYCKLIS